MAIKVNNINDKNKINNSLFNEDKNILQLVNEELKKRGINENIVSDVTNSFNVINYGMYLIEKIDNVYQQNFITKNVAKKLAIDMFERNHSYIRLGVYSEESYKRLDDLLNALSTKRIDQRKFLKDYTSLLEEEKNFYNESLKENIVSDVTNSFNVINYGMYLIEKIDNVYQQNFITKNVAKKLAIDMFERNHSYIRLGVYSEESYKRLDDLLNALSTKRIDQRKFLKDYTSLLEEENKFYNESLKENTNHKK